MTAAPIVAIAFALAACTTVASGQAKSTLTVDVADQSGARIPDASVVATGLTTGLRFEAKTDARGQAVVQLDPGSYELKVQATGFEVWKENEVEVKAEIHRAAVLMLSGTGFPELSVDSTAESFPLERPSVAYEIPLMPIQPFIPAAKPLRRKAHWL